jgi:23S rRNA (adenine2030-N6)-methyltransferase
MNYRHAYHAGNHTEVSKHSALVHLLLHLRKKPTPFMVLDTHAGAGLYDLSSEEATKTGEAREGIGQVIGKALPVSMPYLDLVRKMNAAGLHHYPGSPVIVRSFLRENDRLVACELHDEDAALLRANLRNDRRISVHHRDGYEAALAFIPPPERRGLVFIDPPFEAPDELDQLGRVLASAVRKWPTGMFAGWYPIKDQAATGHLRKYLVSMDVPKCLLVEFLRLPEDGERLAGSGMILCNPPWQFDRTLRAICTELLMAFNATQGRWTVEWLSPER